jgi:ferritin-like metal-binding protein YciE
MPKTQLTKALPKMAKAATSKDLKAGFEKHLKQTEGHVERLEQICEELEIRPRERGARRWKG